MTSAPVSEFRRQLEGIKCKTLFAMRIANELNESMFGGAFGESEISALNINWPQSFLLHRLAPARPSKCIRYHSSAKKGMECPPATLDRQTGEKSVNVQYLFAVKWSEQSGALNAATFRHARRAARISKKKNEWGKSDFCLTSSKS